MKLFGDWIKSSLKATVDLVVDIIPNAVKCCLFFCKIVSGWKKKKMLTLKAAGNNDNEEECNEPLELTPACQDRTNFFAKVLLAYRETLAVCRKISNQKIVCDPLRLCGGVPAEKDIDEEVKKEEDENIEYKKCSPMWMCKNLMDSYDKVLTAYREATSRCRKLTCPVPYVSPPEDCKMFCGQKIKEPEPPPPEVVPCETPGCPYLKAKTPRDRAIYRQTKINTACGIPSCPYTIMKTGITEEEIMESEQRKRIADAKRGLRCPVEFMPPLKPEVVIHWDCVDPFPIGPCRNTQCPLKPPQARYVITPMGPCSNVECPFASPIPCGEENCPYSPTPPCYTQPCWYPQPICPPSPCPPIPCPPSLCPPPPPGCGSPPCPYSPPCPPPSECENPDCPFAPPPSPCGNKTCPFAIPKPKPKKVKGQKILRPYTEEFPAMCDNPCCPSAGNPHPTCFPPCPPSFCPPPLCPPPPSCG